MSLFQLRQTMIDACNRSVRAVALAVVMFQWGGGSVGGSDWPAWRHDAGRSAVTHDHLPFQMHSHWKRDLGANHVAWPEDPRLHFDAAYEPIAVGRLLIVASAQTQSVTAYDTRSGEIRWRHLVDAPVRLAPVAHLQRVYFGSGQWRPYVPGRADGEAPLDHRRGAATTARHWQRKIDNAMARSGWNCHSRRYGLLHRGCVAV